MVLVFGSLLYANDNPFQIAFLIAPYYAIVLSRALCALPRAVPAQVGRALGRGAILVAAVAAQAFEIGRHVAAHRSIGNPMFAMDAQQEIVSALLVRGIESPLTTTYNSVGFYEFLSDHRLRPVHLYPLLLPGRSEEGDREAFVRSWKIALMSSHKSIVLPLGYNIFEGGRQDPDLVREALLAACESLGVEAREVQRFPALGPAAFGLYEIAGAPHPATPIQPIARKQPWHAVEEVPASAGTRAALGGLEPGLLIGSFLIESVTGPSDGSVLVHARSSSGDVATFEVRLLSSRPAPPAHSGAYAVYYRSPEGNGSARPLVEGAQAIADRIARAPADSLPLPGLTRYPERVER